MNAAIPSWLSKIASVIVDNLTSNSRYLGESYLGDDERRDMEAFVMDAIIRGGVAPLIILAQQAKRQHSIGCVALITRQDCTCGAEEWNEALEEALR